MYVQCRGAGPARSSIILMEQELQRNEAPALCSRSEVQQEIKNCIYNQIKYCKFYVKKIQSLALTFLSQKILS
jgi:hypothetical protein